MKQIIASLSISACLLLPSAGVVFANDPHSQTVPGPMGTTITTNATGQPGSNGGITCQNFLGPHTPGSSGANPNSPFGNANKVYAGAGVGGSNSNAVSEYDVSCYQQSVH
jgi:hypothetical protein